MTDKELFQAMKEYIEECEERIEDERGECRSFDAMLKAGDVPEIYHEIINRLEILNQPVNPQSAYAKWHPIIKGSQ